MTQTDTRYPVSEGWSAWPAPAKLNLFLRIVGRREDGYHLLQTVFRLLDWGDTVYLRLRADGRIVRHGESVPGVAAVDDLAVRAAVLLQKEANIAQGADIAIEKHIPAGGGFGGGSSDAATVLRVLDRRWACDLGVETLANLGLRLGADVPVFVRGQNAWAEGLGEVLSPLPLPPAWYLLAMPGVHAPTAALFQSRDLTRNAEPATIAGFASDPFLQGPALGNAFAPVLRHREPLIDATLAALSAHGAARLTGSGSACFVEFADRESAERALRALPEGANARIAAGASRSPLLDRLDAEQAF